MRLIDLPESKLVGTVPGTIDALTALLSAALVLPPKNSFSHAGCIKDRKSPGRFFTQSPYCNLLPLIHPIHTPEDLARELVRLQCEMNYKNNRRPTSVKGWEIRTTKITNGFGVIAFPVWV
jgi:hypothetical protein